MTSRNAIRVFIFSFTVLIVLLRPYAAYQISMRPDIANDPVKVNSLLQRLIKKKDDHHMVIDEAMAAVISPKTARLLPIVLSSFLAGVFALLFAVMAGYRKIAGVPDICPRHKHYLSLLRIRL